MPLALVSVGGAEVEDELSGCTDEDSGITSFGGMAGFPWVPDVSILNGRGLLDLSLE